MQRTIAQILLYLLLAIVLVVGFYLPIHTDEINWSPANHRGILDGGWIITLMPQCQEAASFAKPLPWLWYPHAWANHLLFNQIDSLIWLRVVAMARAGIFIGLCVLIIRQLSKEHGITYWAIWSVFLAALCINELPLLLLVLRPEQTLLLATASFIAAALYAPSFSRNRVHSIMLLAGLLFTALLTFPAHPKAVMLTPVIALCTYRVVQRMTLSRSAAWLSVGALTLFSLSCALLWIERYDCPLSELSQDVFKIMSLPVTTAFSDPWEFLMAAIPAFLMALWRDFFPYYFVSDTQNWLPLHVYPLAEWTGHLIYALANVTWMLLTAALLACMVLVWRLAKRWLFLRSTLTFEHGLFAMLILSLVGVMTITGYGRIFYLTTLEMPLLLLALCIYPASLPLLRRYPVLGKTIMLLAVCNLALLLVRYYPYVTDPATRYAGNEIRTMFMSPFDSAPEESATLSAYKSCGLPELTQAQHLITDMVTYTPLKTSHQPFNFHYVTNIFSHGIYGYDTKRLLDLMERYESDGLLIRCDHVPPDLQPLLTRYGDYCCMRR